MSLKSLATVFALGARTVLGAGAPRDGLDLSQAIPVDILSPELFEGNNGSIPELGAQQAFRLIDNYDASNWFSKFTVENVSRSHYFIMMQANNSRFRIQVGAIQMHAMV